MTPQQWPEPINEMLSAIDRQDGTLWAMPIVSALESQSAGSALDMAITALTAQLPGLGDARAALAERWLTDLKAMRGVNADPAIAGSLSREIWFYGGSRDEVQTAIARLYAALSSLKAKSDLGYRREIAMALAVVTSDPDGRLNVDKLRHLIELFVQVIQ
jgi:hypothetical protein